MIAGCLLATLVAAGDLDRAIALAREGRFVEALAAAEAEPDPIGRAQALFHVRHHAGDLDGALAVAATARGAGASSAWLEEREAFVALTIRDAARVRRALDALAARPDGGGSDLVARAAALEAELRTLDATLRARDEAARRARLAAGVGLAILVGGALVLARARAQ